MRTRIVFIGIAVCLVSACGLIDSHKFNPHKIDGYWQSAYVYTIPGPSSDPLAYKNQFVYKNFLVVNYPYLHVCSEKQDDADSTYWQLKENLKIAHTEGNFYKIEKINDIPLKSRNLIYEFKKDTTLTALEIIPKNASEKNSLGEAIIALLYNQNYPPGTTYSECRSNAIVVDTLF